MLELVVHVWHIFYLIFYCVSMLHCNFFFIRGLPFVALIFLVFGAKWMYMNAEAHCLAIYSFLSQIIFMLHHKIWTSIFRTLRVRRTRSHWSVKEWIPKPSKCLSVWPTHSHSVSPESFGLIWVLISVQLIWTVSESLMCSTASSYTSRCHRFISTGATESW